MDTKILRSLSYGVYIVGTMDHDRPTGCTANSIMQITSSPATIAVSINHDNYTNQCIKNYGKFSFSILSNNSQSSIIGGFGFRSGKDCDKFDEVDHEIAAGCPVIKDSCGYVVCQVIDTMETSSHTVFLGEIIDCATYDGDKTPMTYAYYHQVIKGKSPKNAPTYIPEETSEATEKTATEENISDSTQNARWVCQVCGYVYEGDSLPEDFKCPWCGQGAEKFKRAE